MNGAQWLLELALVLLLGATLFHALRLERALGVLKRDRAVLEELVQGFNDSTRQAESGIERLRSTADGAGRQMARQIETGQRLKEDLTFLVERSDRLAERLESAVRSARMMSDSGVASSSALVHPASHSAPPPSVALQPAQQVERVLRAAPPPQSRPPRMPPRQSAAALPPPAPPPAASLAPSLAPSLSPARLLVPAPRAPGPPTMEPEADDQPRLRSQAERDLLRALRGAR